MHRSRGFALLILALATPLIRADAPSAAPSIQVGKSSLDFKVGDHLIARYVHDPEAAKPYFWPVNPLPGLSITRAWPMENLAGEAKDHVHQKSAWFCHGDVIPEGLEFKKHFRDVVGVDFWSERKGHGKMVCVAVEKPVQDRSQAKVITRNEWRTAEGQKILDEMRTITLIPMGPNANLLVLDIELKASVCPITFGDTKEGSLGVRVRESVRVDRGKGVLVNAEGKLGEGKSNNVKREGCWGLVSTWCDYSGPISDGKGDSKIAGIALFADPANKYDSAWHARNYGLLGANPFGRDKHAKFPDRKGNNDLVKLAKGESLKLRFGIYLHAGNASEGKVAEAFKQFEGKSAGQR